MRGKAAREAIRGGHQKRWIGILELPPPLHVLDEKKP
jgi:hypothetical protein